VNTTRAGVRRPTMPVPDASVYVANIYKYYVAYRLVTERRDARETAKDAVGK